MWYHQQRCSSVSQGVAPEPFLVPAFFWCQSLSRYMYFSYVRSSPSSVYANIKLIFYLKTTCKKDFPERVGRMRNTRQTHPRRRSFREYSVIAPFFSPNRLVIENNICGNNVSPVAYSTPCAFPSTPCKKSRISYAVIAMFLSPSNVAPLLRSHSSALSTRVSLGPRLATAVGPVIQAV